MPEWNAFKVEAEKGPGLAFEVFAIEAVLERPMEELQAKLREHLDHLHALERDGTLVMSGPLSDTSGEEMRGGGLIVVRAASFEAAREIARGDPLHAAGIRSFTVRRWLVNEGQLRLSVDLASGHVTLQ